MITIIIMTVFLLYNDNLLVFFFAALIHEQDFCTGE